MFGSSLVHPLCGHRNAERYARISLWRRRPQNGDGHKTQLLCPDTKAASSFKATSSKVRRGLVFETMHTNKPRIQFSRECRSRHPGKSGRLYYTSHRLLSRISSLRARLSTCAILSRCRDTWTKRCQPITTPTSRAIRKTYGDVPLSLEGCIADTVAIM